MASGGSSGRADGDQFGGPRFDSQSGPSQFSIAPLSSPSTKWVAKSLKTRRSKGAEESNGKLSHNAVCQEQSGPYFWFPNA
ncbi:hypothetical protein PoB_007231100 [Plakobranchus ocellatus]|uniref:Uncharacterized protein n=1 Tax=Plakobranchus ocellatus TaxID=259542 RepID=A0AAV4DPH1_9GAST|nr:hypothetical protein PoB_007231100 [Plakobranchus ocellatus]